MSSHSLQHRHLALRSTTRMRSAAPSGRDTPDLARGERVLYRGPRRSSGAVVATTAALHYRPPEGAWRCIAWADAVDVQWAAAEATLTLRTSLDGPRVHRLAADAKLAALADDRIAHAHLIRRRVELLPGISGVVEAVLPTDDAAPVWRVLLDDPARRRDPAIAQACRDAIAEVRSVAG